MYDEEIGYVQGISFVAASLLLHVSKLGYLVVYLKCVFKTGNKI